MKLTKHTKKPVMWVGIAVANALVILVAASLYPDAIVLGNAFIPPFAAACAAAVLLTVWVGLIVPFVTKIILKKKNEVHISALYGIANILGLWILSRFALSVGLGIASVLFAVILGVVLTGAQYGIWKATAKQIRK